MAIYVFDTILLFYSLFNMKLLVHFDDKFDVFHIIVLDFIKILASK